MWTGFDSGLKHERLMKWVLSMNSFVCLANVTKAQTSVAVTSHLLAINMDGTFQAAAGFQDSDIFQKAIEKVLRCILSVILHISGFKL